MPEKLIKNVLVYGSKEFSGVVKELVISCGHNFVGFIDDINKGNGILGTFEEVSAKYPGSEYEIALAIGYKNLQSRWSVFLKIKEAGYNFATLIHPASYVAENSELKEGSFVMAGSVIDIDSRIDEIVVVWPGVIVNHNCIIGANTFLSPNSTICGTVEVGKNCFIGAGAVIVDHVNVPDNSFVKAGIVYK